MRLAIVKSKQRSGNWEAETILGKAHQGTAVTLGERKSKDLLSRIAKWKTAALVGDAMPNLLRPFSALVLTLPCDNDPIGTIGLLRQFVLKTENLRTLDPQRLQKATNRLNHRPRKMPGYRPRRRSSALTVSRLASCRHPTPRTGALTVPPRLPYPAHNSTANSKSTFHR